MNKSKLIGVLTSLVKRQSRLLSTSSINGNFKLLEVGVLNDPRAENYETGQLFLHKLFGYRGVVLFPWTAFVFDRTDESSSDVSLYDKTLLDQLDKNELSVRHNAKKSTYYQVLIDSRDIPYVRSMPESVTFLSGSISNRSVYTIHGLDYVAQSDLIPYTSTEKTPIYHDLFDKFLRFDPTTSRLKRKRILTSIKKPFIST